MTVESLEIVEYQKETTLLAVSNEADPAITLVENEETKKALKVKYRGGEDMSEKF